MGEGSCRKLGGGCPWEAGALKFLTWVAVFLKLTSNLHRELFF